ASHSSRSLFEAAVGANESPVLTISIFVVFIADFGISVTDGCMLSPAFLHAAFTVLSSCGDAGREARLTSMTRSGVPSLFTSVTEKFLASAIAKPGRGVGISSLTLQTECTSSSKSHATVAALRWAGRAKSRCTKYVIVPAPAENALQQKSTSRSPFLRW